METSPSETHVVMVVGECQAWAAILGIWVPRQFLFKLPEVQIC